VNSSSFFLSLSLIRSSIPIFDRPLKKTIECAAAVTTTAKKLVTHRAFINKDDGVGVSATMKRHYGDDDDKKRVIIMKNVSNECVRIHTHHRGILSNRTLSFCWNIIKKKFNDV
jgi:hypothetical protein